MGAGGAGFLPVKLDAQVKTVIVNGAGEPLLSVDVQLMERQTMSWWNLGLYS